MRNLLLISTVLALGACGISEDKYGEKFSEKFCDQITECGADMQCPTGDTEVAEGCEYDKAAAKDCINGEWGCDSNSLPTVPTACANVYTNCGATNTAGNTGNTAGNTNTNTGGNT